MTFMITTDRRIYNVKGIIQQEWGNEFLSRVRSVEIVAVFNKDITALSIEPSQAMKEFHLYIEHALLGILSFHGLILRQSPAVTSAAFAKLSCHSRQ
jgi:hypothetical protein